MVERNLVALPTPAPLRWGIFLFDIIREMNNFWQQLEKPFFVLAPMEAVTDVVFRHVVAAAGAPNVWYSEFTNATGWVHAGQKAIGGRLIRTSDENPIVAQIWGGEPGDMEQLATYAAELGYHGIDINMGCPAKSAIKSGGAALIRQPKLAVASIAAAKTAGLPVSVKTRLGYSHVDEWREWLGTLLRQDIVNLTVHLRTKREMSKVPAHHELIPEIVKLRDEIAPHTLLTINGDIVTRAHGEQLVRDNPGVDGVMIGRGIFHDPFAFAPTSDAPLVQRADNSSERPQRPEQSGDERPSSSEGSALPAEVDQDDSSWRSTGPEEIDGSEDETSSVAAEKKRQLLGLLELHLELFDKWQDQTGRPYETLKRFFKIYVREFDGASEMRSELMQTKTTEQARQILHRHQTEN